MKMRSELQAGMPALPSVFSYQLDDVEAVMEEEGILENLPPLNSGIL